MESYDFIRFVDSQFWTVRGDFHKKRNKCFSQNSYSRSKLSEKNECRNDLNTFVSFNKVISRKTCVLVSCIFLIKTNIKQVVFKTLPIA